MSVYYDRSKNKWVARKFSGGNNVYIGAYNNEDEALDAERIFMETGEKLPFEPTVRNKSVYHSTPLITVYPSYEELLEKNRNQIKVLSIKYN